jgi:hypothetical protein
MKAFSLRLAAVVWLMAALSLIGWLIVNLDAARWILVALTTGLITFQLTRKPIRRGEPARQAESNSRQAPDEAAD